MGEILRFPIERRRDHIRISFDIGWSSYFVNRIDSCGKLVAGWSYDSYADAFETADTWARAEGLAIVDICRKSGAA
ncbi:hypothetical protein [Sphingopyxis macrogoltabida]|uniref:Uncharacterized protein n=1 Tax=Sphingopyxis macrogoltabida TaxID=33050 RepID=A0A0N7GSD3_SPHMC|nr:hypothetical protein [Sphingopyxis macrogoltabida]ALH80395.1 hypothetical protein AN936_08445 [Sphingopyxis macrogoltabida]